MKKNLILVIIAFGAIFTSCRKDLDLKPVSIPETMEELVVSSSFNWLTTKDFTIVFSTSTNGLVEVTNAGCTPYQKVFLVSDKAYTMKLTVPTYETKVKIKHGVQLRELELNDPQLFVNF